MSEESMSLEQYRAAKASGVDLLAQPEVVEDAAPIEEVEQEIEVEQESHEPEQEIEDDLPPIPEKEQSAWQKRAERERRKAAEETEARLKAEYEAQINPYKQAFEKMGITPEQALQAIEQSKIKQEAERLAYQNGWSDEQAEMYVQNQQQQKEMRELRVSVQINDLADSSDYPGIKQMKSQITDFVARTGATVQEAYWAVGGQPLAQQLKREAEQREIAKRSTTARKVVTDSASSMPSKDALPPEAIEFMKREGMSEAQVRRLLDSKPMNQTEYRKMMKK
jgi:hypothetical protein